MNDRMQSSPAAEMEAAGSFALQLREAQLRGILDSASEAIVTADQRQIIVMANRAAAEVFRCRPEDLIGRPLTDLMPARHRARHREQVAAYGAERAPARRMQGAREVLGLRADGEEFPIEAAISQAHADGLVLYTVILRDLTAERHAAAARVRNERLLAASFTSNVVGMAQIDPVTRRYVAVNDAFCRLSGYTEAELLSMDPDRLNHPDDRRDEAKLAALLHGDTGYRVEKRLVRRDATPVWVEVTASVVREADGHPRYVVGIVQDITARREAEEALRARAAHQSFIVRLNDGLRALEDPRAIAREAARLLCDHLGASRAGYGEDRDGGEFVAAGPSRSPDVPAPEEPQCTASASLMPAADGDRTLVRPDVAGDPSLTPDQRAACGRMRIGAAVAVPLASRTRAVFFVHAAGPRHWTPDEVALIEDSAHRVRAEVDRARAESAVHAAKAELEAALDSMTDAVFITDAAGRLVLFNAACADFYRYPGRDHCPTVRGRWSRILEMSDAGGAPVPPRDWALPRALRGERGSSVEHRVRRKDTGEQWVGSFSYAPIRDGGGRIAGAVVTARDVTAWRRVRHELEAYHAELQRLVDAQDRVQEDERLRVSRELHDETLQSLVAVLMEVTAARARSSGSDPLRTTLDRIERLTVGTIQATRRIVSDLRPAALDELGLVPALQALAAQFADRHGIDCELDADALTSNDESRLGAALSACLYRSAQEALNNVARHASARSVRLVLEPVPPSTLVLTVSDDGVGMAPGSDAKPQSFGLLGMRERVRAVGGTLRVSGREGRGTTVELRLPLPDGVQP